MLFSVKRKMPRTFARVWEQGCASRVLMPRMDYCSFPMAKVYNLLFQRQWLVPAISTGFPRCSLRGQKIYGMSSVTMAKSQCRALSDKYCRKNARNPHRCTEFSLVNEAPPSVGQINRVLLPRCPTGECSGTSSSDTYKTSNGSCRCRGQKMLPSSQNPSPTLSTSVPSCSWQVRPDIRRFRMIRQHHQRKHPRTISESFGD